MSYQDFPASVLYWCLLFMQPFLQPVNGNVTPCCCVSIKCMVGTRHLLHPSSNTVLDNTLWRCSVFVKSSHSSISLLYVLMDRRVDTPGQFVSHYEIKHQCVTLFDSVTFPRFCCCFASKTKNQEALIFKSAQYESNNQGFGANNPASLLFYN